MDQETIMFAANKMVRNRVKEKARSDKDQKNASAVHHNAGNHPSQNRKGASRKADQPRASAVPLLGCRRTCVHYGQVLSCSPANKVWQQCVERQCHDISEERNCNTQQLGVAETCVTAGTRARQCQKHSNVSSQRQKHGEDNVMLVMWKQETLRLVGEYFVNRVQQHELQPRRPSLDSHGHHRATCPRAGVLNRRGFAWRAQPRAPERLGVV